MQSPASQPGAPDTAKLEERAAPPRLQSLLPTSLSWGIDLDGFFAPEVFAMLTTGRR